jgi:hypothetical protein
LECRLGFLADLISFTLLATIYHQLGIDASQTFKDHTGRPHPILDDPTPIKELV